jgi:hypothetical protein
MRLITGLADGSGQAEGQPGGFNLVACVFEYLHARWAMAGLVGVSETVRAGARLAAGGYQRLVGDLRMRQRWQGRPYQGQLPGRRLPERLVPAAA